MGLPFPLLRVYHQEQAQVPNLQTAPPRFYARSGKDRRLFEFFCRYSLSLLLSWNEMKSCHQSHLWHRDTPMFHAHACTETHTEGNHPLGLKYRNSTENLDFCESLQHSPRSIYSMLVAGSPPHVRHLLSFPSSSLTWHLPPPDCSIHKSNSIY